MQTNGEEMEYDNEEEEEEDYGDYGEEQEAEAEKEADEVDKGEQLLAKNEYSSEEKHATKENESA